MTQPRLNSVCVCVSQCLGLYSEPTVFNRESDFGQGIWVLVQKTWIWISDFIWKTQTQAQTHRFANIQGTVGIEPLGHWLHNQALQPSCASSHWYIYIILLFILLSILKLRLSIESHSSNIMLCCLSNRCYWPNGKWAFLMEMTACITAMHTQLV